MRSQLAMALGALALLVGALSAIGDEPAAPPRFRQRFEALDVDGDGVLSKEEVGDADRFEQADKNKDGKVSRGEALRFAVGRRREAQAKDAPKMKVTHDLRYAEIKGVNPRFLSLDVYAPPEAKQLPVMVMIHGGGWRVGDKENDAVGEDKASYFVGQGYVYVSVNYRLSPAVQHPAHVEDVAAALAYVCDHIASHGGDPNQIFVMGHSAGAHLAALVSTDDRYLKKHGKDLKVVKGVILLDGAGYDIPYLLEHNARPTSRAMYESAFGDKPAGWKDASPITHVGPNKNIPPFLILHITREASKAASEQLCKALNDAGAPAEVREASGKTHGAINQDVGKPNDPPTEWIEAFLKSRRQATGNSP